MTNATEEKKSSDYHILVAAGNAGQLDTLLSFARRLLSRREGRITLLAVTPDGERPPWLVSNESPDLHIITQQGTDAGPVILKAVRQANPDLLLLGWQGTSPGMARYLQNRTLDNVLLHARCNVAVIHGSAPEKIERILIPVSGGPNASLALELALQLAPEAEITTLYIARLTGGAPEIHVGRQRLRTFLETYPDNPRLHPKVVSSAGIVPGILKEAGAGCDLTLIGATQESLLDRLLFGNVPQAIALKNPGTTIIVKRRRLMLQSLWPRTWRVLDAFFPSLTPKERAGVIREMRNATRQSSDFFVMISLSALIATLGLFLNNVAIIIGAMLIAPLMSAIMGVALGISQGDGRLLWTAANTTLRGLFTAVLVSLLFSFLVPIPQANAEILSRSAPTLLDLVVALASGAAGAYATCRRDVSGALAGVAISVALIPPLSTVGIGVRIGDYQIAGGALLLFATNVVAIIAAGGLVLLLVGFRPPQTRKGSTRIFQRGVATTILLLVAISIPLGILTFHSVDRKSVV